jgi:hypothetical protein
MTVSGEQFNALCEQVLRLALVVERLERSADPDGPYGWELRESRQIADAVKALVGEMQADLPLPTATSSRRTSAAA